MVTYEVVITENINAKGNQYVTEVCPETAYIIYVDTNDEVLEDLTIRGKFNILSIRGANLTRISNITLPEGLQLFNIRDNNNLLFIENIQLPDKCNCNITSNANLEKLQNIRFAENGKVWIRYSQKLTQFDNVIFPNTLTYVDLSTIGISYLPCAFPSTMKVSVFDIQWYYSPPVEDLDVTYIAEHALTAEELAERNIVLSSDYIAVWYYQMYDCYTGSIINYYSVREITILPVIS